MTWIMLIPRRGVWRYLPAEPPCWKGEITIPLLRWTLAIGWDRTGQARSEQP